MPGNDPSGSGREDLGVVAAALSHDGQYILAGFGSGDVGIWRTRGPKTVKILRAHRAPISAVAFSPNGDKLVATASYDGQILLHHLDDDCDDGEGNSKSFVQVLHGERVVGLLGRGTEGNLGFSWGSDNTILVTAMNMTTSDDGSTKPRVAGIPSDVPVHDVITFLGDCTLGADDAVTSDNDSILATNTEDPTCDKHANDAYGPDGPEDNLTGEDNANVQVPTCGDETERPSSGNDEDSTYHESDKARHNGANTTSDIDQVPCVYPKQFPIVLIRWSVPLDMISSRSSPAYSSNTSPKVFMLKHDSFISPPSTRPSFSPDNTRIAIPAGQHVTIWDTQTGEHTITISESGTETGISDCQFSADGFKVVTCSSERVAVWDAQSGDRLRVIRGESMDGFWRASFWPTRTKPDRWIYCLNKHAVVIYDSTSGEEAKTLCVGNDRARSVHDSAGEKKSLDQGLPGPRVVDVKWLPWDGKEYVVAGYEDGTLIVWDVEFGGCGTSEVPVAMRAAVVMKARNEGGISHVLVKEGQPWIVAIARDVVANELRTPLKLRYAICNVLVLKGIEDV
ncbi:WD40 repeat-like protein [Panus rudis PR-1116 ss-1]|nr:WD40 repeat-like protein [Panus rudis PR-1116 ss-1]